MKKRDLLLIIIIIVLAGIVWFVTSILYAKPGGKLLISVDNQQYGMFELSENQTISIGDTNVCQIQGGIVSMTQAKCPDKVCVHTAPISKTGQTIICMPNRIVLEIAEGDSGQIDTMVE